MKIAKIISTTAAPRSVRKKTILSGTPPKYSTGSQNYTSLGDIKKLINLTISEEVKTFPGADVDLIFVNNKIGNKDFDNFILDLNHTKLPHGEIYTIESDNIGWSFGAYNAGYKKFRNNYNFFIFTEDDTLITRENYASIGLDTFFNTENCGFVAYSGLSSSAFSERSKRTLHAHGGIGLTSKKILDHVISVNNKLPFCIDNSSYKSVIMEGEVRFTNIIHELGYTLTEIPNSQKYFDFAYDFERGIDLPINPNFVTLANHFLYKKTRENFYKFAKALRIKK